MATYNHAMTVAYEVKSSHAEMPTFEEAWEALLRRIARLILDDGEAREALLSEAPFDTYQEE